MGVVSDRLKVRNLTAMAATSADSALLGEKQQRAATRSRVSNSEKSVMNQFVNQKSSKSSKCSNPKCENLDFGDLADALTDIAAQRPGGVSRADWLQTIDAGGRFLDDWGSVAVEFGWTPGNLFDTPRDGGSQGGLVWFLNGEDVRALGPEHAVTVSGRVYDRGPAPGCTLKDELGNYVD